MAQQKVTVCPRLREDGSWTQVTVSRIEELSDAVYGAGLEALQLSASPVTASLAFAARDGVTYSTAFIEGRVMLAGPLSKSMITFGVGLRIAPGSRHWLKEVATCDIGVFLPGDEHDALYMPGALYATATLSTERLEQIAENAGVMLNARALSGSCIHSRPLPDTVVTGLRKRFECVHARIGAIGPGAGGLQEELLRTIVAHFGRPPRRSIGHPDSQGCARIVARARAWVLENLDQPISIDAIAAAACTSRRTLYRAFQSVLDETPQSYVRKLRLHRIRDALVTAQEPIPTIASVAHGWGIGEVGRLSCWYREAFGELPSETLARRRRSRALPAHHASRSARSA